MTLDPSDSVALVALIVSLIALLVTFVQLLQSSATTADGWRQCSRASIGRWAMFRDWEWHWKELRYEVLFTTPEILLVGADEVDLLLSEPHGATRAAIGKHVAAADVENGGGHTSVPVSTRLPAFGPGYRIDYGKKDNTPRKALHILGLGSLPAHIEEQWQSRPQRVFSTDLITPPHQKWWHTVFRTQKSDGSTAENSLASWAPFLGGLYCYQRDTLKTQSSETPLVKHQTFVAIRLRQDSWDFVPPELVRPPARARLGDILLMTQRMGWSWTRCDPSTQEYHADSSHGQGCTIYSSAVRGLGTVFHFETLSRVNHFHPRQMLCSDDADKMFFGIIPKCDKLGIPEIQAVGKSRKIDWHDLLYRKLEFPETYKELQERLPYWSCTVQNDMLTLLAPFMPLENCPFVRIRNPIPSDGGRSASVQSFFAPWQSRCSLLFLLEQSDFAGKENVLQLFARLRQNRLHALWCNKDPHIRDFVESNVSTPLPSEAGQKEIIDMVRELRLVHDATTTWLEKIQSRFGDGGDDNDDTNSSFYMNLVRAHFDLVAQTAIDTKAAGFHQQHPRPTLQNLQNLGRPHGHDRANLVAMCTAWVPKDPKSWRLKHELRKHYTRKQLSVDEIVQSWWYLIIRGIAWRMSVEIEMPDTSTLVPWFLYRDRSHVWIM